MKENFLTSSRKLFEYYKSLGEKAMAQIEPDQIHWQYNDASNSIAIIVKHLHGNMLSRWTNFLTEDGEKPWRDREGEFEDTIQDKEDLLDKWEAGWKVLLDTLGSLQPQDVEHIIYIRNQGHTVGEAIQRQLAHYAYHVGQIVFVARMIKGDEWQSLSIPKGKSQAYNAEKFEKKKNREHFTDEWKEG